MNRFPLALTALGMVLCSTHANAQADDAPEPDNDNRVAIGIGALVQQAPFNSGGAQVFPIPLVSIRQGPFYFEGMEAGVRLESPVGKIIPTINLFVAARGTSGIDRQKVTADAGIRASIASPLGILSGEVRRDITGEFDGSEVIARYSFPISTGRFTVVPALQASWLDRKTANYMYGVTTEQRAKMIARKRDVILPVAPINEKAINLGGDISVNVQLSDRLMMLGILSGTYLDKSIHNSPAIDQKWESQAILGLAYSF